MLIEEVVHRENMLKALSRVVGNKGAPGIDGRTVEDLESHCRDHWEPIRLRRRAELVRNLVRSFRCVMAA